MIAYQKTIESPIGDLHLVASDDTLLGIHWNEQQVSAGSPGRNVDKILRETAVQLAEYFAGQRQTFTIPLSMRGTPFQLRVWDALRRIPYGATKSYKDIACELNDANACRAVGTANGRNPISIIVPCHRVVNAGGALGGYAGGLEIKSRLLDLERLGHLL